MSLPAHFASGQNEVGLLIAEEAANGCTGLPAAMAGVRPCFSNLVKTPGGLSGLAFGESREVGDLRLTGRPCWKARLVDRCTLSCAGERSSPEEGLRLEITGRDAIGEGGSEHRQFPRVRHGVGACLSSAVALEVHAHLVVRDDDDPPRLHLWPVIDIERHPLRGDKPVRPCWGHADTSQNLNGPCCEVVDASAVLADGGNEGAVPALPNPIDTGFALATCARRQGEGSCEQNDLPHHPASISDQPSLIHRVIKPSKHVPTIASTGSDRTTNLRPLGCQPWVMEAA